MMRPDDTDDTSSYSHVDWDPWGSRVRMRLPGHAAASVNDVSASLSTDNA